MRYIILTALLLLAGCTSWQNPTLDMSVNRSERFQADRDQCRERAQKRTHAAPDNDLPRRTYSHDQSRSTGEAKVFQRCMSAKGWVKK
ncbi:hypothetical protein [Desulfovibrio sp. JC022]|uniref:hypothetical protein n=1 Tax=Desulfovibrio sp. JC022 TaxID=2593642 RepID=UPI0013D1CAD6|nr:hypothetical protein [Desulfovibrio sp. JC022]NDV21584.1 hypothetical protein [Desulfovibrio sp. JC022]